MNNNYINNEVYRISRDLSESKDFKKYILYKSNNLMSVSCSEDDWHYCLLVLQYVKPISSVKTITEILEFFLKRDRYRDKFDSNWGYLNTTIKKVISESSQANLIGSSYYLNTRELIQYNAINSPLSNYPIKSSCKVENVLKVFNFFSCFFLDTCKYSGLLTDHEIVITSSHNSVIKISMFGGLLNYFDLMIFMGILYNYKLFSSYSMSNIVNINFSSFDTLLHDNGSYRGKYINSLIKLSKVHLEGTYITMSSKSNHEVCEFSGSLLSFNRISMKSSTDVYIYLSEPILHMLQSMCNYSIVNWNSFVYLSDPKVRSVYFYFCLNVKLSRYFTVFSVDKILHDLYVSSCMDTSIRFRKSKIRKILMKIFDLQSSLIDFEFQLVFSSCKSKIINGIKVRRNKIALLN
uniref:Uncharacterized protein n=1 Tax=Agarophyton chilense TaxID=2510777 RepID=O49038_AGACH|nr:ORF1 [Agarophyton chilense]